MSHRSTRPTASRTPIFPRPVPMPWHVAERILSAAGGQSRMKRCGTISLTTGLLAAA